MLTMAKDLKITEYIARYKPILTFLTILSFFLASCFGGDFGTSTEGRVRFGSDGMGTLDPIMEKV